MSEKIKEESFEKKLERLEEIVSKVESNVLPLKESMSYYEEGIKIIKDCETILKEAKSKVVKEDK